MLIRHQTTPSLFPSFLTCPPPLSWPPSWFSLPLILLLPTFYPVVLFLFTASALPLLHTNPPPLLIADQLENAMFLNKAKEQLGQEKASFPHASASSTSSPHYPTAVLAIPGSVDTGPAVRLVPKQEGGGVSSAGGGVAMSALGSHLHTTQNITVVPVPSTGIMTAGE